MDTLQTELAELKAFIADLKADRAAQKEKERREAWVKYTSLSIVFLAVLAAVATQWSGRYTNRTLTALNDATFQQAKASDQWSYYQAKSIKQNLYEIGRDQLQSALDPAERGNDQKAAKPYRQRLDDYTAKIAKYKGDQKQIETEARGLEQQRDDRRQAATDASRHGAAMGSAVAIFQTSIALSSICLVTKRKSTWYLSLLLAVIATYKMVLVWLQ